ncbi:hypothetical protein CTAYLR_008582 [Chrysophaeum taylorii]|uniref:non-specific serine/threonine protein kinase n=1 Tax=Chrysophaeum taylorii TaxID=2483200 RepID=A0AAD7UH08_9STRA|nr:hypothetical protein CTAYLR_008582 [Chrysophaeum taylorii]
MESARLLASVIAVGKKFVDDKEKADEKTRGLHLRMRNLQATLVSLQDHGDNLSVHVLESTKVTLESVIDTCHAWTRKSSLSKYRDGRKYAEHFKQLETDLRARVEELTLANTAAIRDKQESFRRHQDSMRRHQESMRRSICARLEGGKEMFYEFDPPDSDNRERASLLGQGAFGHTHRVKERGGVGLRRAMKIIDIDRAQHSGVNLEKLYNEAKLLAGLNHPNIVGYISSFEHGGEFFIVMEYVDGGHLGVQIGKSHDVKTLRRWGLQLFLALDYIHGRRVLHRDLKPENVLLVIGDSSVKLADFGLAAQMLTAGVSSHVGTFNYMSPQKATNNQRYDAADDMWGSGCVLGELLTGTPLHERCPHTPLCNDARAIKDVCTQSREADGVLGAIVRDLLVTVPAQRPSAAEAAARLEGGGGASKRLPQVSEERDEGDDEAAAERSRRERVAREVEKRLQREEAERKAAAETKRSRREQIARDDELARELHEQQEREKAAGRAAEKKRREASERFLKECNMTWRRVLERLETDDRDLKELNLYSGTIGDPGAVRLAKALEKNTSLQSLDLGFNSIWAEGAVCLAESLEKNTSLKALNLGGNSIGAEGAARLAESLEMNTTLQTLDLGWNSISDQGAAHLAAALEKNTSLQMLKLWDNDIGTEGAARLAVSLEKNTSLQTLDLKHNTFGKRSIQRLRSVAKKTGKKILL